jgi:hypothetical protein
MPELKYCLDGHPGALPSQRHPAEKENALAGTHLIPPHLDADRRDPENVLLFPKRTVH